MSRHKYWLTIRPWVTNSFLVDPLAIKKANRHALDWLDHSPFLFALVRVKCATGAWFPGHTQTPNTRHELITCSRKWRSFSTAPKSSRHLFFLRSFWSCERFVRPIFAQIYLIPNSLGNIWWTVILAKFKCSLIIRNVKEGLAQW